MDKPRILEFRDFIRDLKPNQFDASIGIAGPVPSYEQFSNKEFDVVSAGTAEWCTLFAGEDVSTTDIDGNWYWDEDFDYALFCADYLSLYNERILRKLFANNVAHDYVIRILGLLLIHGDEDTTWAHLSAEDFNSRGFFR